MLELRKRADRAGEPDEHGTWPLEAVELVGDAPRDHNFSDAFVARALADGYLELAEPRASSSKLPPDVETYSRDPVISGKEIVLHLADGDLRYKVLEHPGKYADENEPSGFRVTHEYRCRLVKGA